MRGFSLEPPHAFSPQRSYYLGEKDALSPWTFARDDLMYLMWGRLGYDPSTPESLFRELTAYESKNDRLWDAILAASDIVPWLITGHSCGLDSREFAPELELGGDVGQWAKLARAATDPPVAEPTCDFSYYSAMPGGPFDTFAFASPSEAAADLVAGTFTSRVSPRELAARILADAAQTEQAADFADLAGDGTGRLERDLARECLALGALGRYFGHKLLGATALAVYARTGLISWLTAASSETALARAGWKDLAARTSYIVPFYERLRMGAAPFARRQEMLSHEYAPFHWSMEIPALDEDLVALRLAFTRVTMQPPQFAGMLPAPAIWLTSTRSTGPGPVELHASPALASASSWTVQARFANPVPDGATVHIIWKPFESEKNWVGVVASRDADGTFSAAITGGAAGALFAVEVRTLAGAWRYPDPLEETPYVSLAP